MPRPRTYSNERAAIKTMLRELGTKATLRNDPQPSVFLDGENQARFYGETWLAVYALVLEHFRNQMKTITPKTLS